MNKKILAGALSILTPTLALADVSNEFIVGLEHDTVTEVTRETVDKLNSALNSSTDLSDEIDKLSTMLNVGYSHFFTPLKTDETPIDLRRFYQHPSLFNVGVASYYTAYEDSTDPTAIVEYDTIIGALMLNAEFYLPSNTGFLLGVGSGSGAGTNTLTTPSTSAEGTIDSSMSMYELGVRQYVTKNLAFHIKMSGDQGSTDYTGDLKGYWKSTKQMTQLGGQVVFGDLIGLLLDVGKGKAEEKWSYTLSPETTNDYDVADVKAKLSFYGGNRFSINLGVDLNSQFQTGMTSGYEHEIRESKVRLAPRFWFSEKFGMEIGLYRITNENLFVTPTAEYTDITKSSGVDLHFGVRF